jgi:AcrR family transcriptional regulator
MATQLERREATRARLVEAARRLFVERGYEATSTNDVLEAAGVSRGALYHHFATKQELFAAVFERVSEQAITRALSRTGNEGSALQRLESGCLAWLAEARRPAVAAILLDQGPAVLGWRRARDLENRTSLGLMKAAVGAAVEAGELRTPSVELLASVLNAVLAELALAQADRRGPARADVEAVLRSLTRSLASARD